MPDAGFWNSRSIMSYAGDVTPQQAWDALAGDPRAILVDCRTHPEWTMVGLPDLSELGRRPHLLSWQIYPDMAVDPSFVAKLGAIAPDRETPVYFICRSGVRSRYAAEAATAAGYGRCFNVAYGFEGDLDADRHRGRAGGWKVSGLPWAQD